MLEIEIIVLDGFHWCRLDHFRADYKMMKILGCRWNVGKDSLNRFKITPVSDFKSII